MMIEGRSPAAALPLALLVAVSLGCRPGMEHTARTALLENLLRDGADLNSADGNWPCWRGANSSGVAPAGSLPERWSMSDGVAWRVEIAGEGNSSPVVWNDAVLLTTAAGRDASPALSVICFDRTTGGIRWQTAAGRAGGRTHAKNGFASATVATDGERIFAFFGSAGLVCLDFDGREQWHAPLGDADHVWGSASSPVLYGDLVIQLCDRESDSLIAAFDKQTGRQVWRTGRESYGSWSTPVLVEAGPENARRSELVVNGTGSDASGGGKVIAYDPLTGAELWRVQGTSDIVCPTAIVSGGLVYSTSGRNGPILAIEPGGSGNVTASHVVWNHSRGAPYVPTGVAMDGRLYLVSDNGMLACYDSARGEAIWQERLGGSFTASLVAGDGKIYAANERGSVYVVRAGDAFELLATNEMHDRILATPAISRGQLFIRTASQLVCIASPGATEITDSEPKQEDPPDGPSPSDLDESDEPPAAAPVELKRVASPPSRSGQAGGQ